MTTEIDQKTVDAWSSIVARAWRDPAFKAALLADPRAILAGAGIAVPESIEIVTLEDTAERLHVVLPARSGGKISDGLLDKVAGGFFRPPGYPSTF